MNGAKLIHATEIVAKAGLQIEALIEKMSELIGKELKHIGSFDFDKIKFSEDSLAGWATCNAFRDIELRKSRSRKAYGHLAFQVFLYDSEDLLIENWEPAIYLMYDCDKKDAFDENSIILSQDDFRVFSEDSSVLIWDGSGVDLLDSWLFVVPLVQINDENGIKRHIVEPAMKLLQKKTENIFPEKRVSFRFDINKSGYVRIEERQ